MKNRIEEAYKLFKEKDFKQALKLYQALKEEYKTKAFDANIFLCENKLGNGSDYIDAVTLKSPPQVIPKVDFDEKITVDDNKNQSRICLVRIIGNDLPGLHSEDQTLSNLEFIMKNEPSFEGVDKVYLINNIISEQKYNKIKYILNKYKAEFFKITFDPNEFVNISLNEEDLPGDDYLKSQKKLTDWDLLCMEVVKRRHRNAYLMNNNGARNAALEYGFSKGYGWVLPFDGNCFISEQQFEKLKSTIDSVDKNIDYLVFPMERCQENTLDLATRDATNAVEEPQIGFKRGAVLSFDKNRVYGNQPKVDLLRRLGVPGVWDSWTHEYPWKPFIHSKHGTYDKKWVNASSVFRLASGNEAATASAQSRGNARAQAIVKFIDEVYDYSYEKIKNKSIVDFFYYKKSRDDSSVTTSSSEDVRQVNQVFDQIYLVSLEKDIEKRLKVERQLMQLGVKYRIFPAVNGYVGAPLEKYNEYIKRPRGDLKVFAEYAEIEKKRSTKLIESAGAVGYIYTYINIIKDAKRNKFKNILIIEDDIIFVKNFIVRFDGFIKSLPLDWKILHLGASQYGWKSTDVLRSLKKGYYHPRIHDTKGSFAIALNEDVFDELVTNQMAFEAPFDHLPIGVLYEKYLGKCFVAFPYLVMPDVSVSTIRGKRDQYEHANRMKWWVGDFSYPQNKLNVGIVLNSKRNIKYLNQNHLFESAPFKINLFYMTGNGLQPLHDFSLIDENYAGGFKASHIKDINVSVDILLEAQFHHILTIESIQKAVENIFFHDSHLKGFKRLETGKSNIVDSRVSVILPTYKRPSHLERAIESVLVQDYQDIELIVVDDNGIGSEFEAATKKIIEKCKSKFPNKRLKYLQHKLNANGASARNTGILHSTGGYICFLDDDDIYLPGRISKSIQVLKYTNDDTGGIYCGFLGWNSKELDKGRFAAGDLTKELLTLDYKSHYLHTNTATYKRAAVFHINGFDTSYRRHQDLEFNIRFFQCYKIDIVKECLVRLAPEKSNVDNKVYGLDMFNLKSKFLSRFENKIDYFDEEVKKDIYMNNWKEVIRYAKDMDGFMGHLRNDFSNGSLQIMAMSNSENK